MIHRIDVSTAADTDPVGRAVRQQILDCGLDVGAVTASRIFLIDAEADESQMLRAARELLADPIVERADLVKPQPSGAAGHSNRIEVHLKAGVMDPVAASTEMALRDMGIDVREVRTGRAYVMQRTVARAELERIALRGLANSVIESVHFEPFVPPQFPSGRQYALQLRHVPIRDLSDDELKKLSREAHLFLSLAEMKAIQDYYRRQHREPTDVELETLAQTWSEHCVHKTLKSAVEVVDEKGNGLRRYGNLIKDTIFASTMELMAHAADEPFCLSVFRDNAGVIAFDEADAVCFKVETHNHPSAIEPYGGSATGIGGVIRDVLGTGLAAKPIANTDIFCVAYPDAGHEGGIRNPQSAIRNLPSGVIHPKRILRQVVAGVRDYGNRMGIPTANGAVYFDDNYIGNPLVFCGCVGLIPRDKIHKAARKGDAIVLIGGRTGRDGIHGATFSSAELTDTHADEFSHAVQIGNAITEKKMADVILQARDLGLFSAITDCGAGGLSSAVGEMGQQLGAIVELENVPLKYAGLRYDEIWISEAQERMVLAVPQPNVQRLLDLARGEDVEATVIGRFGTETRELILHYEQQEVARLSMQFLHDGIPMPTRRAVVTSGKQAQEIRSTGIANVHQHLLKTLAHPNVASKHWIIRQYDHEVQGGSVVKPLTGPLQIGPSDAAVIRPKLSSVKGIAIACGLAPHVDDPYAMTIASIDEAVRNVVCVGADPSRVAILDNFCWPSVDDEHTMGTLVAACEACRDAALAYGIPFISGKDSLHNQFTNQQTNQIIRIPRTLLISAIGVIDDVGRCVTMDLKKPGATLALIRPREPHADLPALIAVHRFVAELIRQGALLSCHDVSDGGVLVAAAEMCIASGLGLELDCAGLSGRPFDEPLACYLVELASPEPAAPTEVELLCLGKVNDRAQFTAGGFDTGERFTIAVDELARVWRATLDW